MLRRGIVGRRVRPPHRNAAPTPRAPGLPAVAQEAVSCGRRQQQQELCCSSGLGQLPRLRPPAGRAVPTRRAGALDPPDIGVRHVAGDGGDSTSATRLSATHPSTPAALHSQLLSAPLVGLVVSSFQGPDVPLPAAATPWISQAHPSTPARSSTVSNAADRSLLPSARARPDGAPEVALQNHRLSDQQLEHEKNDLSGSAGWPMLPWRKEMAVPHVLLQPPCHAVPEKYTLTHIGVGHFIDGGGPPSVGLLSVSTLGLIFHLDGHRVSGNPATSARLLSTPRCCGADKRQTLMAGDFFGTTRSHFRHDSQLRFLKMSSSKSSFSTHPDAVDNRVDLLSPNVEVATSDVQAAVEKLASFKNQMQIITAADLKETTRQNMKKYKKHKEKERLKKLYYQKIRPALVARGLISPYNLNDSMAAELHEQYKNYVAKEVKYLTCLDLMNELDDMTESYWSYFLDFLSEEKCLIIEYWENSLGASIGTTVFNRSVTFDGSPIHRGECDASFKEYNKEDGKNGGIAMMCSCFFTPSWDILSCIIVKDYECSTSIEAEATAMYILLKDGYRLNLNEDPCEACTDCELVSSTIEGALSIGNHRNADMLKLLRYTRREYKSLITQWLMREKMFWVDGIMRAMRLQGENESEVDLRCLINKMKKFLRGKPVFKFSQNTSDINNLFKEYNESVELDLHQSCHLKVDEKNKIHALSHIITALRPSSFFVVMAKSQSKATAVILKMYHDCMIDETDSEDNENYKVLAFQAEHLTSYTAATKLLWIIFDSSIPEEFFENKTDSFVVFLRTPNELSKHPELSPVSYISFHKRTVLEDQYAVQRKRSPHPSTTWSQISGFVLLVIELPDLKDSGISVSLESNGHFKLSAKGNDDMPYELDLELFGAINKMESKWVIGPKNICYLIKKDDCKLWPRLLNEEGKPPVFIKMNIKLDIMAAAADLQTYADNVVKAASEDVRGCNQSNVKGRKPPEQSNGEEATTGAVTKQRRKP